MEIQISIENYSLAIPIPVVLLIPNFTSCSLSWKPRGYNIQPRQSFFFWNVRISICMISPLSMQQMTPAKVGLEYVCEPIGISQSESLVTTNSISIKAKSLEILISLSINQTKSLYSQTDVLLFNILN